MSKTCCERCKKKTTVLFLSLYGPVEKICNDCREKEKNPPVCCKDTGTKVDSRVCGAIATMSFEWPVEFADPHSPGNFTHYRCSTHRKYATDKGVTNIKELLPSNNITQRTFNVPVKDEEEEEEEFVPPTTARGAIEIIINWLEKIEDNGQKKIQISTLREELLNMLYLTCPEAFDESTTTAITSPPVVEDQTTIFSDRKGPLQTCPDCHANTLSSMNLCPVCDHNFLSGVGP